MSISATNAQASKVAWYRNSSYGRLKRNLNLDAANDALATFLVCEKVMGLPLFTMIPVEDYTFRFVSQRALRIDSDRKFKVATRHPRPDLLPPLEPVAVPLSCYLVVIVFGTVTASVVYYLMV